MVVWLDSPLIDDADDSSLSEAPELSELLVSSCSLDSLEFATLQEFRNIEFTCFWEFLACGINDWLVSLGLSSTAKS